MLFRLAVEVIVYLKAYFAGFERIPPRSSGLEQLASRAVAIPLLGALVLGCGTTAAPATAGSSVGGKAANSTETESSSGATGTNSSIGSTPERSGVGGVGGTFAGSTSSASGGIQSVSASSGGMLAAAGSGGQTSLGSCSCSASQGCLKANILVQQTGQQPWLKGDPGADGVGTLVVAAFQGRLLARRVEFPGTDVRNLSSPLPLVIGCVPAGELLVQFFLDDNVNGSASATSSSDPSDTCGGGTQPIAPVASVTAGAEAQVTLALGPACQDSRD